jgi:hypothetical protein
MSLAAWDSIASLGGFRIPLPIRSAMISSAATCQFPARASSGTTDICSMYPPIVTGQYRPGPVGAAPGQQADVVAEELAGSADNADRERSGAEQPKVRAGDTARAFIGEVGEKAHDPDHEHELQRRGCIRGPLPHAHRGGPGMTVMEFGAGWAACGLLAT